MYKFVGIISHEDVGKHIAKDVVTLPLPKPHVGFISSFGNIHVVNDSIPDYQVFTKELSHTLNQPLLYLEYLIWGGLFDYVKGEIWHDGTIIFQHEGETVKDFLDIMLKFGLVLPDDGFFAPFVRNFFARSTS